MHWSDAPLCKRKRNQMDELVHKKVPYLRTHGLHSVPNSIKAIMGDLVYNETRSRASNDPPPGHNG